jgi:putative nucleotidyltransferase with HDIG domain
MEVHGYITVAMASLVVNTLVNFDLYLMLGSSSKPVLYRKRNLDFTQTHVEHLEENRVTHVLIHKSERKEFQRYIETHLGELLDDEGIAPFQKTEVLYECSRGLMMDVMREPRAPRMLSRARDLVEHTIDFMSGEETVLTHLMNVVSKDYYTYTHSVNVMTFSVSLAARLGYDSPQFLKVFAEGALLHDVGKSVIDHQIINCPGKLSEAQWQIMKKHPEVGYSILSELGKMDEMVLQITRSHHEKLDGSGYPDGLRDKEISRFVRMVTIADVYDALTSRRSYKNAFSPADAVQLMRREMGNELDQRYFNEFSEMIVQPHEDALMVARSG